MLITQGEIPGPNNSLLECCCHGSPNNDEPDRHLLKGGCSVLHTGSTTSKELHVLLEDIQQVPASTLDNQQFDGANNLAVPVSHCQPIELSTESFINSVNGRMLLQKGLQLESGGDCSERATIDEFSQHEPDELSMNISQWKSTHYGSYHSDLEILINLTNDDTLPTESSITSKYSSRYSSKYSTVCSARGLPVYYVIIDSK